MGLFSNDDELANALIAAGIATDELLWRLPLSPEYDKYLDSKIADMQNIAPPSAGAGSITAAQFLKRYIKNDCRWAHIDFAGTAYTDSPGRFHEYGASGDGVRLVLEALPQLAEILDISK
jgi:leucyl aminopeptidase